jgi:dolichyl-diphosphooligosaccharide--protein glycosyltransferase
VLYGLTAVYFSGVMVRLMLVLAPAVCCLAGVAVSDILNTLACSLRAHGAVLTLPSLSRTQSAGAGAGAAPAPAGGSAKKSGRKGPEAGGADAGGAGAAGGALPGMSREWHPLPRPVAVGGLVAIVLLLLKYSVHCIGCARARAASAA